jgi:predicted MFS family arabinose efflux permease
LASKGDTNWESAIETGMTRFTRFVLFLLFLVSGFCGLLYQIVWLRMAFASFGVVTSVLSIVVSVFMLGLYVGSWAAGRWIDRLTECFPELLSAPRVGSPAP